MRVRIDSIWRDIKHFNYGQEKIDIIANNDDTFEFGRTEDLKDVAVVISMRDLFDLINDSRLRTVVTNPKKTTKKKEIGAIVEDISATEYRTED